MWFGKGGMLYMMTEGKGWGPSYAAGNIRREAGLVYKDIGKLET